MSSLDIRRAESRFATRLAWLDSKHSFSFGHHYDPDNTHHGLLRVNNEDVVQPGTGFDTHAHRDMEIVTWVLSGSLVHQDSTGHRGIIYPGLAQRMSAGRGIRHSERNDSWTIDGRRHDEPVRLVQMWVVPDETGIDASYEQAEVPDQRLAGGLVPVASGMARDRDETAVRIHNADAALLVARLEAGGVVELPDAPFVHLFVADGSLDLEGTTLHAGDAVRLTAAGSRRISATEPTEILVWEMHASSSIP